VRVIQADPTRPGPWLGEIERHDAVVNLAGERIIDPPRRWTRARKQRLWESRVSTTENIVTAIRAAERRPTLVSGSAIGFYGDRGDVIVDEDGPAGSDFLGRLASAWEAAACGAQAVTRVTLLRIGIVLGPGGGALAPLLRLFRLGLGGPWGSGRQWWSWIHLTDAVGLILMTLDREVAGAINLTAPNPVTVNEFAAVLGGALRRPAILRVPAVATRLAFGEAAAALLNLQRVIPRRALALGYSYRFPSLPEALRDVVA
jgi:uncharacterized protein (TIGR01777 family)